MKLAWTQSVKRVRDERFQIAPETVVSSTPDLRKRSRELTVIPQDTAAKKPKVKRPENLHKGRRMGRGPSQEESLKI